MIAGQVKCKVNFLRPSTCAFCALGALSGSSSSRGSYKNVFFFRKARKLWPSRGEGKRGRDRERPVFGGTVRRSHRPTNLGRRLRQRSPRLLLWELWDLRSGTSTPQRMRHLLVYAFRYVERYLELVSHSMCMCMCICVCILVVCLCECATLWQTKPADNRKN